MDLLTREIEDLLPPLSETDDTELDDKIVYVKYFVSGGTAAWYIVEGSAVNADYEIPEDEQVEKAIYNPDVHDDYFFFGLFDPGNGQQKELSNISLGRLENGLEDYGAPIERDLNFVPQPLGKFLD